MPETPSKPQILKELEAARRLLNKTLSQTDPTLLLLPGVVGDWSGKDVLAHLAEWEARMVRWVERSRQGEIVQTPDDDLTWAENDLNNQRIYEKYRHTPLEEVLVYFHAAHTALMALVEGMGEDELLHPGFHPFTGGSTVHDWLHAFANHDVWGRKKIKTFLKEKETR